MDLQHAANWLVDAGNVVLTCVLAAVLAGKIRRASLSAPEVRELVRELDASLEKFHQAAARDGMRRVREIRRQVERPPEQPKEPDESEAPSATDRKGELWQIVHARGLAPTSRH